MRLAGVEGLERLSHADERIPIPDPLEASAWARAFAIYERLRDRAVREEQQAVVLNRPFLDDQRDWMGYIENRQAVLAMLQRGIVDERILVEHLGLQLPDDLASPTTAERNKYGSNRHPDWRDRAKRLSDALFMWGAMSAGERIALKQEHTLRRLKQLKEERA
jgi:hypothetical protein